MTSTSHQTTSAQYYAMHRVKTLPEPKLTHNAITPLGPCKLEQILDNLVSDINRFNNQDQKMVWPFTFHSYSLQTEALHLVLPFTQIILKNCSAHVVKNLISKKPAAWNNHKIGNDDISGYYSWQLMPIFQYNENMCLKNKI